MNSIIQERTARIVDILKISGSSSESVKDGLAVEEPLEISITILKAQPQVINKNISITMRTPGADADLAIGFLFTEGIIRAGSQIDKITSEDNKIQVYLNDSQDLDLSKLDRHFYTSSSCGVCGKASLEAIRTECQLTDVADAEWQVAQFMLYSLPGKLRVEQELFASTGGIHAAALFDTSGKFLLSREDVGRHNALDKLIGATICAEGRFSLPLNEQLLLLSGRASFELIQKAVMAGVKFVMAIGAPSSLAVDLAKEHEVTLVGFLKQERYNVYTGAQRIKFE